MKNAAVAMMVVAAAAAASSEAAAAPTRVATVLPVHKPCAGAAAACGAADEANKWVQPEMRAECDASPCGPKPGATWVDHSHFTGVKGSAIPWAQPARQVDHVPEAEAGRVVVTHEGEWQAVPAGAAALAEFMASASPVKVLEGGHNAHGPLAHGQTVRWVSPEELRGDRPKKRMVPVQQLHPDEYSAADKRNRIQGVPADEAKEVRSDIVRPSFLEEPQKVATTTVLHPFTTADQGRSAAYVPPPGARTVKVPATVVDADQVPQEGRVSAAAEPEAERAETMLKELEAHSTDEASAPWWSNRRPPPRSWRASCSRSFAATATRGTTRRRRLDAASRPESGADDDDAGQLESVRAELRHAVEKAKVESVAVGVAARGTGHGGAGAAALAELMAP